MENASEYPENVPGAHDIPQPYTNAQIASNSHEDPPPPYLNAVEFSTPAAETTATANQESNVAPITTFADVAVMLIGTQTFNKTARGFRALNSTQGENNLKSLHQKARQHDKNYTVSKCPTELDAANSTAVSAREDMREFKDIRGDERTT